MNDKFKELYAGILKELWDELQRAEAVYLEISQTLVRSLNGGELASRIADQEKHYQQKISGIISNLGLIYSGRIELFPFPANSCLLQRMEIRNRQLEALERILTNMFEYKNTDLPRDPCRKPNIEYTAAAENDVVFAKPNIMVCGSCAVGKTSLIQAVTHTGTVPDNVIGYDLTAPGNVDIYETPSATFIDGDNCADDFEQKEIHAVWYCIDGSGGQLSGHDTEQIKNFSGKVLLVVTKRDLMRKEQSAPLMNALQKLIPRDRIVIVSAENKTGLPRLIQKTLDMTAGTMDLEIQRAFRKRWNDYYLNMRKQWLADISDEADTCIKWAAPAGQPATGTAPVFLIYKLAGVYGLAIDKTVVAMLLKCADFTSGVGKAAKAYFESGMTLDITQLRENRSVSAKTKILSKKSIL